MPALTSDHLLKEGGGRCRGRCRGHSQEQPAESKGRQTKLGRHLVPGSAKLVREVSLYPTPQTIYRTWAAMLNFDWSKLENYISI